MFSSQRGWMLRVPLGSGMIHDRESAPESQILARWRVDRISCSTRFTDRYEDSPGGLLHTGGVLRRSTPVGGGKKGPSRPHSPPPDRCAQTSESSTRNPQSIPLDASSGPGNRLGPSPSCHDSPICAPPRPARHRSGVAAAAAKVGEPSALAFARETGSRGKGVSHRVMWGVPTLIGGTPG